MIHASEYKPRIFPYNGDVAPVEIDRAQAIDPTGTLNRDRIEEIGREGIVGYVKRSPTVAYRMTQLEYGSFEFWRKLANKEDSVDKVELSDFKTPTFDICAYKTDDDGTFKGTVWYPKLRTAGFSVGIGDPDATIERTFDFVGEKAVDWQGDNKYFIYLRKEMGSGETGDVDIVIGVGDYADYPDPVKDPDTTTTYILRVLRVRSSVTTELTVTTDYTYVSGTKTLTIKNSLVGDIVKAYYTATTYISGSDPFVKNDVDVAAINADSVTIELGVGTTVYRLQSAGLDIRFDREDVKELGNTEVVQRGIRNSTVTITLGRFLEDLTIEEILRGVSADYGKIDIEKFADDITLTVKIYEDNTKDTFKLGLKATNLTPTEVRGGAGVNAYVRKDNTLEGEELLITSDEGEL